MNADRGQRSEQENRLTADASEQSLARGSARVRVLSFVEQPDNGKVLNEMAHQHRKRGQTGITHPQIRMESAMLLARKVISGSDTGRVRFLS